MSRTSRSRSLSPSLSPGSPTIPEKVKLCAYRNPASVPGHPFIVNRKHYGEGCFLPTGGGWAQHVEQRILPQMEGFEEAGFEMYSDIRNPLGRGQGAPDDEHMNGIQLYDAPGWLLRGLESSLSLIGQRYPGRSLVYMGNLTGNVTASEPGPADALWADDPDGWADYVIDSWQPILSSKTSIGIDVLYARLEPTSPQMVELLPELEKAVSSYKGLIFGEPFDERGAWTEYAKKHGCYGTYTAFRYWDRMGDSIRESNTIKPAIIGDFNDTDGSLEQVSQFIADRHKEGVIANISGSHLDRIDPRKLFDAVMKRL